LNAELLRKFTKLHVKAALKAAAHRSECYNKAKFPGDENWVVDIESIWRQNVNPRTRQILETPYQTVGTNFETDKDISPYLIFVTPKDSNSNYLGLYNICAPFTITKRNAVSGNNEFLSKFGIPNIVYKSDIQDDIYRNNIEEYLSGFSNLGYLFANKSDEISLIESSNNSNQSFRDTIDDCNKEIAKIICGSNIAADKAFVGAAETHEKLLTLYTESDKRFIENIVNGALTPQQKKWATDEMRAIKDDLKKDDTGLSGL